MPTKEGSSPQQILEVYGMPPVRKENYFGRGAINLLAPLDYKMSMLIGDPDSETAIITAWGDPWHALPEDIVKECSVAASLRIPWGVDLMLHNLASNPHIRRVGIYAAGKNDNTETGQMPLGITRSLWTNGVTDEGGVIGTGHKLSPELVNDGAIEAVRGVLNNVELCEWSHLSPEELLQEIQRFPKVGPYGEKVVLPEFKIQEVDTWPSELEGLVVRRRGAFNAWLGIISSIMRYGREACLETATSIKIKELPFVRVVIEGERPFDDIPQWALDLKAVSITPEGLEDYYQRIFRPERHLKEIFPGVKKFERPKEEKYLYGELIHAFPRDEKYTRAVLELAKQSGIQVTRQFLRGLAGEATEQMEETADSVISAKDLDPVQQAEILLEVYTPRTNQVAKAIERIRQIPDDADKTFILWDPETHGMQYRGRPCLLEMGLLVRDGAISGKAVFRTHDMAKGWLLNAYGIWRTVEDICKETGYKQGPLVMESESAHFYKGDINWVNELWQQEVLTRDIAKRFDSAKADPRGNIVVDITPDNRVVVKLTDPKSGATIHKFEEDSAREALARLSQEEIISQPGHGLDIGLQLGVLEVARRLRGKGVDIVFTQDQPFKTWGAVEAEVIKD